MIFHEAMKTQPDHPKRERGQERLLNGKINYSITIKPVNRPKNECAVSQHARNPGVGSLFQVIVVAKTRHFRFWIFQFLVGTHECSGSGANERVHVDRLRRCLPIIKPGGNTGGASLEITVKT